MFTSLRNYCFIFKLHQKYFSQTVTILTFNIPNIQLIWFTIWFIFNLNVEQVSCNALISSIKSGQWKARWTKSHVAPRQLGETQEGLYC